HRLLVPPLQTNKGLGLICAERISAGRSSALVLKTPAIQASSARVLGTWRRRLITSSQPMAIKRNQLDLLEEGLAHQAAVITAIKISGMALLMSSAQQIWSS
ncbi:MAG TPA: hypothetical protein QF784_04815, partial [Prochlorococcaceae cyanobacterium Fu_MAG_134]|nr:hypothetical protein [Prochlorococcaceae cyanobacterium Fu_MAG_134]